MSEEESLRGQRPEMPLGPIHFDVGGIGSHYDFGEVGAWGHYDHHYDRIPHIDSPHYDGGHLDLSPHDDVLFLDIHGDANHQDFAHEDIGHVDTHYDSFADVHGDDGHQDIIHVDAHNDYHYDLHYDHEDSPHDDMPHDDNGHADHEDGQRSPWARLEDLITRLERDYALRGIQAAQFAEERFAGITAETTRVIEVLDTRLRRLESLLEGLQPGGQRSEDTERKP